jgi:hypothetical protein
MSDQDVLRHFTYQAAAVSWPFFVISTIIFFLRGASRIWFTELDIGWDDMILSISWVCASL